MMDERYMMIERYSTSDRYGRNRHYTWEEKAQLHDKLKEMKYNDPEAFEELMYKCNKHSGMYGYNSKNHFTREKAEMAVRKMENVDGTKGEHWSFDEVKRFINAYKINIDEYEYADFYYVINMFYSDYKRVFEKLGINNTEAYIKMTEATLTDPDAPEGAVFVRYEATH